MPGHPTKPKTLTLVQQSMEDARNAPVFSAGMQWDEEGTSPFTPIATYQNHLARLIRGHH